MPMMLFIQVLIGAIFSPALIKSLNKAMAALGEDVPEATDSDIQRGIEALLVKQAAPPTTAGATKEETRSPSAGEVIQTMSAKPANWFGLALLGFAGVFVISQMRAAGHEVTETSKDLYNEGKRATSSLANADKSTINISRRLKK